LLSKALKNSVKIRISKINPEFLQRSLGDEEYVNLLNKSDISIVDGRGVLWAARYLTLPISSNGAIRRLQAVWQMVYSGAAIVFNPKFVAYPIPEAIPGLEAFRAVIEVAIKNKVGVFLFGANPKSNKLAVKNLKKEFPDLIISGSLNGYDFQKDNGINVVGEINKTDARVLIVALGSPKQERWIDDNIDNLKNIKIAVGEGGTLDRIAYPAQKAPKFVNKIGLEWLWRLAFNKSRTESRNRFGRFWNSVPLFIHEIVKWKVKNGQTKA